MAHTCIMQFVLHIIRNSFAEEIVSKRFDCSGACLFVKHCIMPFLFLFKHQRIKASSDVKHLRLSSRYQTLFEVSFDDCYTNNHIWRRCKSFIWNIYICVWLTTLPRIIMSLTIHTRDVPDVRGLNTQLKHLFVFFSNEHFTIHDIKKVLHTRIWY